MKSSTSIFPFTVENEVIMEYTVHPNQDGSFSVVRADGRAVATYYGKDAARDAYKQAYRLSKTNKESRA